MPNSAKRTFRVACREPTISLPSPSNNPSSPIPFIRRCFVLLPSAHNNYSSRVHRARRVIPPSLRTFPSFEFRSIGARGRWKIGGKGWVLVRENIKVCSLTADALPCRLTLSTPPRPSFSAVFFCVLVTTIRK